MEKNAKTLAFALLAAVLAVDSAAAGSHSKFLLWQHGQEQKAARDRGYIRSVCDLECRMFGAVVRQLISERSQRVRQQYPASRRY